MTYLISILKWFGVDHNIVLNHCLHNKILSLQFILRKSKHEIYIPKSRGKIPQLEKKTEAIQ